MERPRIYKLSRHQHVTLFPLRSKFNSERRSHFSCLPRKSTIIFTRPRKKFINISVHSSSFCHQMATVSNDGTESVSVIKLKPVEATPETFLEFGQVVEASPDGDEFGPRDALLDLSHGIPRLYIMHLENRPLKFSSITHHASVTQCLGSIGGHSWYLGVAKSSVVDPIEVNGSNGADIVKSHCGHFYVPPAPEDVRIFRISGPKFLKLNRGTWHAGPLFLQKTMDFYNLELTNTNFDFPAQKESPCTLPLQDYIEESILDIKLE